MSDGAARNYREADMRQWVKTGEGRTAESFDHADGKTMMKLYLDFVPEELIRRELHMAQAAYAMGLPTPVPGELIRCGARYGCTFERIEHKRSFSRAMADEPARMEEYALRFADMAKKLHSTPCDRSAFPAYREKLTNTIRQLSVFSQEEKQTLLRFLYSVEDTGTCIHGDLHIGNVVTDGTQDYLIDMGDFSYGNPLFDLGSLFYLSHFLPDANVQREYHISPADFRRFWDLFAGAYFDAHTPEKLSEVEILMGPYSAFHALMAMEHEPSLVRTAYRVRDMLPEMEKYI